VERPSGFCEAEDQATWSVFIFWIIFDNFTGVKGLKQFTYSDVAEDALVDSMPGKFIFSGLNLSPYLINH
jgi:hypothetical protein